MNRLLNGFAKLSFLLSLVLLLLSPWHGLISTWLLYGLDLKETSFAPWFSAWKEILVLILVGLAGLRFLFKDRRLNGVQILIFSFIGLSLVVTGLQKESIDLSQWVFGSRMEFIFLLALGALLSLSPAWTESQKQLLLKSLMVSGVLSLIFGLFLGIFGHDLLVHLGYRNDWSTFYLDQAPAFCQKEGGTEFCRFQSGFTGANRYAGFLLVLIPVLWLQIKNSLWKWLLTSVAVLSLGLTLSATAFLAFFAMIFLGFALHRPKAAGISLIFTFAVLTIALFFWLGWSSIQSHLAASESAHLERLGQGFEIVLEHPWGSGLGFSGPASYRTEHPFVPESWYLQVAINTGILGLILFLSIWVMIVGQIWKRKDPLSRAALFALCGVLVQNLFLHPFEDTGVYFPLVFLVAIAFSKRLAISEAT